MQIGKDIRTLTGLRGAAALHVMIFHYFLGLRFSNPAATFVAHGYLEVDLFFVLSGFLMALNYGRMFKLGWSSAAYQKFLGRRIARVYPLYLVTTICAVVLVALTWVEAPRSGSLTSALISNLLMVQTWGLADSLNPPAWSISAEWAAYLLFPLLALLCLFRRPALAWASGVLSFLVLAGLAIVPTPWGHQPKPNAFLDLHQSTYGFPVLRCLAEFILGLLAFRAVGTQLGWSLCRKRWIAPVLCIACIVLMATPGSDLAVVLLFPPLIASLTWSEQHLPGRLLASAPTEFLGQLSYSIYLVHDLMGGLMSWVHTKVEHLGLHHGQTYAALIAMLLTFPLAYVAFRFIEVPGRSILRDLFEVPRSMPVVAGPSAEPSAP